MCNVFTCVYLKSRCGEDLAELFEMPAIQRFLNGTPSSTLFSHKRIYQPGTLRKVSNYANYTTFSQKFVLAHYCFLGVTKKYPAQGHACFCSGGWKADCTSDAAGC